MTDRSYSLLSFPDGHKSPVSRASSSNRTHLGTSTFDESSSVDCAPESPTLPPDMARDEGFMDISNGDDLKLGPPATSSASSSPHISPIQPHLTSKHSYLRSSSTINNNPIASFVSQSSDSSNLGHQQHHQQQQQLQQQPTVTTTINNTPHGSPQIKSTSGFDRNRSASASQASSKRRPSHTNLRHVSSSTALHQHTGRSSRRQLHLSDHMAAAIELSTSPNVPPAPAAGMYWSRAISFGRGPSRPLRAHTSNLIGENLYVFGGCDMKACFNTLYILDMDTLTWSKPRTTGDIPPPCRAHSCTTVEHDVGNGRRVSFLYVFGGGDGPNYFNNLYVLNTETFTWTKPSIEGMPPSPRRAHTTCSWNSNIIVVGGGDGARALADVHCLDLADPSRPVWSQLEPSGTAPIARGYHTSNLVKDKLIVYGGSDGHECFSDVFVLDLVANKWSQVDVDRAIPRLAHTATQVGSYIFVIGGHDGNRYSNDILLLNLVTMSWESRKIYGGAPSPRGYHTAVLHDSRLYILGGYDGKNVFEDIYLLELSSSAYLSQITNFDIDV